LDKGCPSQKIQQIISKPAAFKSAIIQFCQQGRTGILSQASTLSMFGQQLSCDHCVTRQFYISKHYVLDRENSGDNHSK